MERRYWLEKGQHLIERYKLNELHSTFKNLPHDIFYMAVAPFSGPIAILFDKNITHQFILPKDFDTSIILFNCKGELKKQIPFELKDRLIYFQFTREEDLLIVQASGNYYLIDPYSGYCKNGHYSEGIKERHIGCEVVKKTAIIMRQKTLGITSITGQWQPLTTTKVHPQNPVFYAFEDDSDQLCLLYLTKFYTIQEYRMATNKKITLFTHEYLQQQWTKLVAVTKSQQNQLALVFEDPWVIIYVDLNVNKVNKIEPIIEEGGEMYTYRYKSIHTYKKMWQIGWLGSFVVFSNRKFVILFNGEHTQLTLNPNRIVFEVDGFRLYGRQHWLFREVNEFYRALAIFDDSHFMKNLHEGYGLYLEYRKFQNKKLIDVEQFTSKEEIVEDVINRVIETTDLFIDPMEQMTVFRFISFLKTYYSSQIGIADHCAQFRIINNLKFQNMKRMLTIKQFQYLKYEGKRQFMGILLRYNMHFMADLIFGDSASKEEILMHWAKCKIEKHSENVAFDDIYHKFTMMEKKIRGKKIFTDIARYCIDRGKINLAYRFIELEEHSGRKIMVCLVILAAKQDKKIIEKLLNFAQESQDSLLIYRVIKELIKTEWIENHLWVNVLNSRKDVERHYIRYLKSTGNEQLLKSYYLQNKLKEELGFAGLKHELSKNDSQRLLINKITDEYGKLLPVHGRVTKNYQENQKLILLKEIKNGEKQVTEDMIKEFKSDKQLQYLGQVLLDKGDQVKGVMALSRIGSDNVYSILQRKGKFMAAVDVATKRNNRSALLEIRENCPQELEKEIDRRLGMING